MTKTPAPPSSAPRLCPTCGTRVGAAATKCLVCGTDLTGGATRRTLGFSTQPRTAAPPIRISGPLLIVLGVLVVVGIGLVLGASGVFTSLLGTPTPIPTNTLPPTFTASPTPTETPVPTLTPLPPIDYVIKSGDTCIKIALIYNVSVSSIVELNPDTVDPGCNFLIVGTTIKVPQPTPTPTALPTATLASGAITEAPRTTYTVHAGDTLGGIANFYNLTVQDLMEVNGITDPTSLREGQVLIIPLERAVTPGPTPTPTPPPPYAAPNQLVPADGQAFKPADTTITLQWTSLGVLRAGESYYITVEDVTCNCAAIRRFATTETKQIVPGELRPTEAGPHVFRWNVTTVRAKGASATGQPQYESAGATSPDRTFSWMGGPTP